MSRLPLLSLVALAALAVSVTACETTTDAASSPDPDPTPTETPDGSTPDDDASTTPKALPSAKATQIAVGSSHTCALTTEGAVRCWGASDKGQLGNAKDYTTDATTVPVQVTGLTSGVKMISAGSDVTCAVTATGAVKCWGLDDAGQLGTGMTYTDTRMQASNVPVDVKDIGSGATAVSVGGSSACAIIAGGAVKCWGLDEYGKLGNGSMHSPGDGSPGYSPPVDAVGLTGAVQISVGGHAACAVLGTGAVKCWGDNSRGALGIEGQFTYKVPTDVPALGTDVVSVTVGANNACAIMKSGAIECWGEGDEGQLGDGDTGIIRVAAPNPVMGITGGATSVALNGFACAAVSGAARCWGKGAELGTDDEDGYETYVPGKAAVGLETGTTQVEVGNDYACALTADGAVKCWGGDTTGNLGDGQDVNGGTASQKHPTAVISLP